MQILEMIKRLKKETHVPTLTQFSFAIFFPSIKFPAVICIVLHLQSAGKPLGVHVQRGHNTLAERLGEKQEKTHQISSPGVHGRVHISIPMRRRSDSQSCGSSLPPVSEGGGERHLEDMKHI